MATPTIPQRPARSQNAPSQSAGIDIPQIPPRPTREVARSISPNRERYARSPLNDPAFLHSKPHGSSGLSRQISREFPPRPPSVDFPSVGEEGFEYGQIQHHASPKLAPAAATKTIAGDLPLHAPTASLPATAARSKIAQVTRTDSTQAAAAGIGRPPSESGDAQQGSRRWSSSQPSRPQSLYGKEEEVDHGIPEIGLQIPLYKNAGDVQAPTPSPSAQGRGGFAPPPSGTLATGRHHSRTKSGREVFSGPPGSYGMHGHGKRPTDALEAQWYQKHPEALAREAKGEYGPAISDNRKEWALSSEELNRLVHTNNSLPSMGASHSAVGTPDEQIGYLASEAYTSRMASPQPGATASPRRPSSQAYNESPLRKMSVPQIDADDGVVGDESDQDDDVINIQPSSDPRDKWTGAGFDAPTVDLGPHGGNTEDEGGVYTDKGYGVPILASDEASYRPESRYMQPAVAPELGTNVYYADSGRRNSRSNSRPNSRPTSVHGMSNLTRFASYENRDQTGTPLDDVREYEPLFPDENDDEQTTQKKFDALKKKRPDLARHHFPSRDIWEDTPESSMYQTEVGTPQLPDNAARAAEHEPTEYFETPEQEQARKTNITAEDQQNFLSEHTKKLAKTHLPAHVLADMPTRPGLRHRFPSQDVWEDTPDSALHTTEITPESERELAAEPTGEQQVPQIPARPTRQQAAAGDEGVSGAASTERVAPGIPARPKPQVPARPAKVGTEEGAPLTQSTSAERAKPAVPARPVGSKIASLQAGFMNDLNNRLKLGPQAPKKDEPIQAEEEEAEKAPLADARKGRAKGPSRRKPGASPSDVGAEEHPAIKPTVRFSLASSWTIFEIDEDEVIVTKSSAPSQPVTRGPPAEIVADAKASPAGIEPVTHADDDSATKTTGATAASESTQTGQVDMSVSDSVRGEGKGMTAFLGGRAPEPGSVIVDSDGKEHLAEHDGLAHKVETTGHGL